MTSDEGFLCCDTHPALVLQNSIMARLVDLNWWLDEQMPFVPEKMQVRDQLIWQIKEFHYRHSILSMIYHIRANAFRIFVL